MFRPSAAALRAARTRLSAATRRQAARFSTEAPKPAASTPWWAAAGALAVGGAAGYWYLNRDTETTTAKAPAPAAAPGLPANSKFAKKPMVVFVLGGPGAGKGTQCARLVHDYDFVHLSAGDLLREERNRPGSQVGELINTYIKEGKIVPMEITIGLLETAMLASGKDRFLIDGFPRALDQADAFEKMVAASDFILYFSCPEDEMQRRLLKRGETSGRVDDNIESIRKRFATFRDTSYPVIDQYRKQAKVHEVSCLDTPEGVYQKVRKVMDVALAGKGN